MSEIRDSGREYESMRGEYLSLMASIEFDLTFLLAEYIDVRNFRDEFLQWFTRAPIPFGSKVRLFEAMIKDNTMLIQFGDIASQLRSSNEFRNTLAHSFRQFNGTMTSRGERIPTERVTFGALKDRLDSLRRLENLIGAMVYDHLQGPPVPISADDFADWPP